MSGGLARGAIRAHIPAMKKITAVKLLPGYRLWLRFDDGVEGTVDLSDYVGQGVFALWNDPAAFAAVRVGETGDLVWSDQVDLCPDSLYLKITGLKPEELFPALAGQDAHARA